MNGARESPEYERRKSVVKEVTKTPNILFILADDHGAWAMGCAGNEELKTPNLDAIAHQGVRLENCFCASPVCSPARASIFTGKIPSQHGIHDWLKSGHLDSDEALSDELKRNIAQLDAPWYYEWPKSQIGNDKAIRYLDGHETFTQILAQNGYVCGLSGKWHVGDSFHPQAGFTFWRTTAMGGDNYYYPVVLEGGKMNLKENCYITDYITDNAVEFLHARDRNNPFFLSVNYTAPHSPWAAMHHPEHYVRMYEDCPFASTPDVPPHPWAPNSHKSLKQWQAEKHPGIRFSGSTFGPIPETWQEHRKESLRGYYAAITAMDANIGRILQELQDQGLEENTLVIFSGDNGMSMGHHGIWGKGNGTKPVNMYDSAVKVPALFRLPGKLSAGTVCDQMVSHYDFFQTILDIAGIGYESPDSLPGQSFKAVLEGSGEPARESVVVYDEYGPCRMIRTHQWKLILRHPNGPHELYDLVNDPGEELNLYGQAGNDSVVNDLQSQLKTWFERYVDPALDGKAEAVTGDGQIDSHHFR